ncbi:1-acyl-sn-glycerol-3-phosphate acyltransferase [Sphingomonas sp. SUN039]|uniref:lysophospholipid acyltransferase family protein n=1 Tax=Sphingomonas sp. SUN039 TaxID=2937787 RepID=UPI00216430FF|nr:lysophospholipid acyltransferase family protein [Sphingomonas sp. SUN039]UVO54765.1 1-acyl-sn-glycerol-3-phosphate acyltransferase [Sphingomonas sp. SUN039]
MASPSTARPDRPAFSPERLAAAAGNPPPISPMGWTRIGVRATGIVAILLPLIVLHYLWRALRQSSPWPRLFLGWTGWIAGARADRSGIPVRRNVVFISNHVSWIDILVIAGASGSAFVAKAEIRNAPVVGWLSTLNRTVFVTREDRTGVGDQIERLREALADTWSVTIFPEGTTDDGRSLLPFKSSLLKILEPPPPGVVVQPLMLDYGADGPDIGWLGDEAGQHNALRVLARPGSFRVGVNFLDPFSPVDFPGRKAIAAEARTRIEAALAAVLGRTVETFIGHAAWASGIAGSLDESSSASVAAAL